MKTNAMALATKEQQDIQAQQIELQALKDLAWRLEEENTALARRVDILEAFVLMTERYDALLEKTPEIKRRYEKINTADIWKVNETHNA